MRNLFLIAYDIVNDRRRSKVHDVLRSFGTAVQYSIFICPLSSSERVRLRSELWPHLSLDEDRILLADLGPAQGRGAECIETWGAELDPLIPVSSLTTQRAARIV